MIAGMDVGRLSDLVVEGEMVLGGWLVGCVEEGIELEDRAL